MSSRYRICIIRQDGDPVILYPGSHGERDLVEAIVDTTMAKGVGFLKNEAHVRQDLTEAINEVLLEIKSEVNPV